MKNAFLLFAILFLFACENGEEQQTPVVIAKEAVVPEPAKPPEPEIRVPDYDTTQWIELISLNPAIVLDLRYATTNNFVNEQLYDCGRCFLRHESAMQLAEAQKILSEKGYGLKLFDCYRPLPVQQRLWDKFRNPNYVTPPEKGSMHNRGLAVDLTIIDSTGRELDMGTTFDFFGKEAHHTFSDLPDDVLENRRLLKNTMEAVGFRSIRTEWWHYSYPVKMYRLSDMTWPCDEDH